MIELEAPIKEVTVYADRALITRCGTIELEAGEHELRVNNLPQFLRDSLRASGQGPQGLRILNVDIMTAFLSRPPEAELSTLQDELDALIQQHKLLEARQNALNDRRQWLRALGEQSRDFAKGLAQGQMKPQDCADFFSFTANQALQDAEAAQNLEVQLKQVQQEIAAKKREIAAKQGHTLSDRLAAVVTVAMAQAGTFELELSYLIMGASWHPHYDVRVQMKGEKSEGEVELTYVGVVQQSTGERWENVGLSLSTARPSQSAVLPDLTPWYLNVYTPPMPLAFGAPQAAAPMRAAKSRAVPGADANAYLPQQYAAMPAMAPMSLASTMDEEVHLRATIINTTERVLLSGEASIFLSGEYVGTTKVKTTAPTEKFKIFLGIDDGIKVKRELVERLVEKGNALQGNIRRLTYAYRIAVHNYAANSRSIIIRDHLPVSQHERVKVKVQSIHPTPTERTKLELFIWQFSLPADGEQKIDYRFVVEHPQDMRVMGLP